MKKVKVEVAMKKKIVKKYLRNDFFYVLGFYSSLSCRANDSY